MVLFYKLNRHYDTNQAHFRRPRRMGSYAVRKGLNLERTLVDNKEDFYVKYSLNEFRRKGALDLKADYEDRPNDEIQQSTGKLDEFLQWILLNRHLFLLKDEQLQNGKLNSLNTDFISFRGVLSLLLNISYDFGKPFIIYAEKYHDTHYLMLGKIESDEDDEQDVFRYAGRRFEVYCCEDFSEEEKLIMRPSRRKDEVVQDATISQYEKHSTTDLCFIYRSRINNHSLCYGAEMDAFENVVKLDGPIDSNDIKGVELKTSKKISNQRQESNFRRFKTLKWFTQSFLTNVRKISVGYWANDLIVDEIKEYSLEDLEHIGDWSTDHCLYQLNQILTFIKDCFNHHNNHLLKFTYNRFSYQINCEDTNVQNVLPDFYKNEFVS